MNKTIYKLNFILFVMLIIFFFILEYDRHTLRGTYVGHKCHIDSNNTFVFDFNILELYYDNTFQFTNKNENYTVTGLWKKLDKNRIIFNSKANNLNHIAHFNRHNINFNITKNRSSLPYSTLCSTYNGNEKDWYSHIWGVLMLVIFIITMVINILGLINVYKKRKKRY